MIITTPRPKARQHSRILIDKKPGITKPFKTRQDVEEQMKEILDLIEMGKFDKAEYEANILYWKRGKMLERIRSGKLKMKPTKPF